MKYYKYALPHDMELSELDHIGLVELGHPVLTPAVTDDDGNVTTEATYDTDTILVDVIWRETEPTEWTPYRVKPTTHKHWFYGQEQAWEACNSQ